MPVNPGAQGDLLNAAIAQAQSGTVWTVDTEVTGLQVGFRSRRTPVGLVQLALRSHENTIDIWTNLGQEIHERFMRGEYGRGQEAAKAFMADLRSTTAMGGTPWQEGMLGLRAGGPEAGPENVLGGVFRRHFGTALDAQERQKTEWVEESAALGRVSKHTGVTPEQSHGVLKQLLKRGDSFEGWNFGFDVGVMYESAERSGDKELTAELNRASRQGRLRDLGEEWQSILFDQASPDTPSTSIPLIHRSKASRQMSQEQLLAERQRILGDIEAGKSFVPPSIRTGQSAIEEHPGFSRWLDKGPGSLRERLQSEFRGMVSDADFKTYDKFRDMTFRLQASGALNQVRDVKFRRLLHQSFSAGSVLPDMRYVGLWSLSTISSALGIEKQLTGQGPAGALRASNAALHDASFDDMVTGRVKHLMEAHQKEGWAGFDRVLKDDYDMTRAGFNRRLLHHAELAGVEKSLERFSSTAAAEDRGARELMELLAQRGMEPGRHLEAQSAARALPTADQGIRNLQDYGKRVQNFFSEKFAQPGGVGRAWRWGAAAAGISALYSMVEPIARHDPQTGEPRLKTREIKALPSTVRGSYLHALTQAEMMRRGQAAGIEVPVWTAEGRGYVDAMDRAGRPIEIKSGAHSYTPKGEHVRQLNKYIGATGADSGRLIYIDYNQGPGQYSTFQMEGIRTPRSRYLDEHGITASPMHGPGYMSPWGSGRSWHKQIALAFGVKEFSKPAGLYAGRHRTTSGHIERYMREMTSHSSRIPRRHEPLTAFQAPYLPHQTGVMDHTETLADEFGKRLRNTGTPTPLLDQRSRVPKLNFHAHSANQNPGYYGLEPVRAQIATDNLRFRGTDVFLPTAYGRGGGMGAPMSLPTIKGGANPGLVPTDRSGISRRSMTIRQVPEMILHEGHRPPGSMYVHDAGMAGFKNRPYHSRLHPDMTRDEGGTIFPIDLRTPPRGIQGPWNTQIHGIRAGQFEDKFPFGSQADEQSNVMVMSGQISELMFTGFGMAGIHGFYSDPENFMKNMRREFSGLTVTGTVIDTPDFRADILERMQRRYSMHPTRALAMMESVGFSDMDSLLPKYRRRLPGFADGWKKAGAEGGGFIRKTISGFRSKYGADARAEKANWKGWVKNRFAAGEDFVGPTTGRIQRAKDALYWMSGGPGTITPFQRFKNLLGSSMLGFGIADYAEIASATEEVLEGKGVHRFPHIKDRHIAEVVGQKGWSKSVFGSAKLGDMKNQIATHFMRQAENANDALKQLKSRHPSSYKSQGRYSSLLKTSKRSTWASRTAGQMTGMKMAFGALSVLDLVATTDARAARLGGGVRGYTIGSMAATVEVGMGTVGFMVGNAVGGPLVGIAASFAGRAVGALMGDAIESIGGSLFGRNIPERTNHYMALRDGTAGNFYNSQILSMGPESDARWGVPSMHPSGQNNSDFGSSYQKPSNLWQPSPKATSRKKVVAQVPAGIVQHMHKRRSRSKIRDQRSRIDGGEQSAPLAHINGSRQSRSYAHG